MLGAMRNPGDKPARDVGDIAADSPGLAGALRAARAYRELNRRLAPGLPESARDAVRVACVEGDCLVIAAASPTWASRARMLAPELLEQAAALWPQALNEWRVVVAPGMEAAVEDS